jgi:hypothetical protein
MKSYTLVLMLLFVSLFVPLAGATSGSANYPTTVHVSSSQLYAGYLQLNVLSKGRNIVYWVFMTASCCPETIKQSW